MDKANKGKSLALIRWKATEECGCKDEPKYLYLLRGVNDKPISTHHTEKIVGNDRIGSPNLSDKTKAAQKTTSSQQPSKLHSKIS